MTTVFYAYDNLREELRYIERAIEFRTGREQARLIASRDKRKAELASMYEHLTAYERLSLVQ
jgi:hypothetical protein